MIKSRISQAAADRQAARNSGALEFLIDVTQGKPLPVRDEAGRIIGWTDVADIGVRVSTAQALLRKFLPDISASQVDVNHSGDGAIRIVFGDGLAPPVSQEEVIDHDDSPPEQPHEVIEHHSATDDTRDSPEPAPRDGSDDPTPIRTRRRTTT